MGVYYKLHKPLLGIMADLNVHHDNSQKYQIPTFYSITHGPQKQLELVK